MQVNEMDSATLRRLAGVRLENGKVLSLYVNLDPSEFGTPKSRRAVVNSVLDEAERKAAEQHDLDHEARMALREDIARARGFFEGNGFSAKGAHAIALFAASSVGLFETARLPRPVDAGAAIRDRPWIEPLTGLARRERIVVALVNRRHARVFGGAPEQLEELEAIEDDVHGWHDQGGWSQSRYQRGIEKEIADHLRRTGDSLFARWQRAPFDMLIDGGPDEVTAPFEELLHPYLRERLAGRIDVDVETASADDVARVTAPVIEEHERAREAERLDRLKAGLKPGGRGAAGLDAVLEALNERRVETPALRRGLRRAGRALPRGRLAWCDRGALPPGRHRAPARGEHPRADAGGGGAAIRGDAAGAPPRGSRPAERDRRGSALLAGLLETLARIRRGAGTVRQGRRSPP